MHDGAHRLAQRVIAHVDVAWPVAIVGAQALARVVEPRVGGLAVGDLLHRRRVQRQPRGRGLAHHPVQRHQRLPVLGVAAADVGVHAGEPHLRQPAGRHAAGRDELRLVRLVEQHRVEGLALLVQRQRVAGALHVQAQVVVDRLHRPDQQRDAPLELVDRHAVGGDGVPQAQEADRHRAGLALRRQGGEVRGGLARGEPQQRVAQPPAQPHHGAPRRIARVAVAAVGEDRVRVELGLGAAAHQALAVDQRRQHADGERAAAEAEGVDVVARRVVAADELVEVDDVALQAVAADAAEDGQELDRRIADAVVVHRELRRRRLVDRLEHAPDIGLLRLGRAVAGAVGT